MWLAAAYQDTSLLTQFDAAGVATSSSTCPSLMARMLEALDVVDRDHVLEIGVGTGYNAALLAHRLGNDRVVSLDVDPDLVRLARDRLGEAGYAPTLIAGDGMAAAPNTPRTTGCWPPVVSAASPTRGGSKSVRAGSSSPTWATASRA